MNNQVSYRGNQVIRQVMQLYGNYQVLYSPSELVTFSGCHYAAQSCGTVEQMKLVNTFCTFCWLDEYAGKLAWVCF